MTIHAYAVYNRPISMVTWRLLLTQDERGELLVSHRRSVAHRKHTTAL